jgi:nucleotide-binding universal stress UspA family protein
MATPQASAAAGPAPPPRLAPLRRILCSIDFSDASVAAVAEAVSLARACRGEITVLFVIPYPAVARSDRPKVPAGVSSAVTEDVEALLEPARAAGIPVRVCLKAGRPAHEILDTVRRTAPDLIVMGTHGRGGLTRRALGSVTSEVLQSAACPVLTIGRRRPDPALPVPERSDTVVCAVGLSPSSPRTFEQACQVARATGAGVLLVHVIAEGETIDTREAARRLHALASAHALRGDRIEEVVVAGVPSREILRMAAARSAALVVVGGESLSDRGLSGSTADEVIRRAPCAVLTVRSAAKAA